MTRCGDIMTTEVMTCPATTTLTGAAALMQTEDIGMLPVTSSEDRLLGVVTDRDIVVCGLAENRDPLETTVGEIMSRNVETCRVHDDVEAVMDQMSQSQIRRVPIVDDENRVVGVISQADLALQTDRAEAVGHVIEDVSRDTTS